MHLSPSRIIAVLAIAAAAVLAIQSPGWAHTDTHHAAAASVPHSSAPSSKAGITIPTTGTGHRIHGGTVTFTEIPGTVPNYILPIEPPQNCGLENTNELTDLLFSPVYWFGNNDSPTVDYSDSIGTKPVASNHGKTYTIHLKPYMWSDGEQVTARDLVFYMNLAKVKPFVNNCNAVPGLFPLNVSSYKAVNRNTFQLTFKHSYNATWVQYNEFSQLVPFPLAWDRTSLSQPAPTSGSTNLPDETPQGAAKVLHLLASNATDLSSWGTSPLWSVVDGPFKLTAATSTGRLTMIPNAHYAGSPKPSISKLIELPFTSDTAEFDLEKSGGPSAVTIGALPPQDAPQASAMTAEGYTVNEAADAGFNVFTLNFHNPHVGPVFSQLYFRQALQHLVNQPGWIRAILHGDGVPSYGPVPVTVKSPLVKGISSANPYPYSPSAARQLLVSHGWKLAPGGASYCAKPGTAADECGAGISKHETIAFTINYTSGLVPVATEMTSLQSSLKSLGVDVTLTTHPFVQVLSEDATCTPKQAKCGWMSENWGAGFTDGLGAYYPSGEQLFESGSAEDFSNNDDPKMDKLVNATLTASPAHEQAAMVKYDLYAERTLPYVYLPQSVGTFGPSAGTLISNKLGGYTTNVLGIMAPQYWYLTK